MEFVFALFSLSFCNGFTMISIFTWMTDYYEFYLNDQLLRILFEWPTSSECNWTSDYFELHMSWLVKVGFALIYVTFLDKFEFWCFPFMFAPFSAYFFYYDFAWILLSFFDAFSLFTFHDVIIASFIYFHVSFYFVIHLRLSWMF